MLAGLTQTAAAQRADITISAHQNTHIAEETAHATDAAGMIAIEDETITDLFNAWHRQVRTQCFDGADRTCTRSSAAVWTAKCLMWVVVHHVSTKVTRSCD